MNHPGKRLHAVAPVLSAPTPCVALVDSLSTAFVERRDTIEALLTAVVAGQHSLMLGPPGTAKSALARSLADGLKLTYWEHLFTRFTVPEEVFGPLNVPALQRGDFVRNVNGYFPTAQVAFCDEIFKANSAILNALLTGLNERTCKVDSAKGPQPIPLVSCIGASNELPEDDGLAALFDRFPVRRWVDYVADDDNFMTMLRGGAPTAAPVAFDIFAEQAAARAVTLDTTIYEAMRDVRNALKAEKIVASDRRWRTSLTLIQATAHMQGRTSAEPDDLTVLESVLWNAPTERVTVAQTIQKCVNPNAAKALKLMDDAKDIRARVPAMKEGRAAPGYLDALALANHDLGEIGKRLAALGNGKKIVDAIAKVDRMRDECVQLSMAAMGVKS